jgi:hypothetical protein
MALDISINLVILRIGLVYGPYIDFGLSGYFYSPSELHISNNTQSDKRVNRGRCVRLHEEIHEIIVSLLHAGRTMHLAHLGTDGALATTQCVPFIPMMLPVAFGPLLSGCPALVVLRR